MQAQPTAVEFVPEQHTDFIFRVEGTSWPGFLGALGAAALVVAVVVRRWRRRRRDEP